MTILYAAKEPGAIPSDRAAKRAGILLAIKWGISDLLQCAFVERCGQPRELVIAKKEERRTVIIVTAALGDDIDHARGGTAQFRAVRGIDNLELAHRVDRQVLQ